MIYLALVLSLLVGAIGGFLLARAIWLYITRKH